MAKTTKFYVVWKGLKPGIYNTWDECKRQVDGFEGAQYKSFPNLAQAELAFKKSYWNFIDEKQKKEQSHFSSSQIERNSICVDAACSGNPGLMEYRGVDTVTGKELFKKGPYKDGTNNIGEFLALVHGIAYLTKSNQQKIIYSDSVSAIAWVKNKKVKTNLELTENNSQLFEIIEKAENYLKNSTYYVEIRKWETQIWGEIPADFGRK